MGFLRCCAYFAALGVASFFVGRLLPKSWFHADRFPYRCAPWEAKLYRALRVHAWQDKVPDMSRKWMHSATQVSSIMRGSCARKSPSSFLAGMSFGTILLMSGTLSCHACTRSAR